MQIKARRDLVAAIRDNNSKDVRFGINYWVPHHEDSFEESSLFQAFLPGILSTSELIIALAGWPADIRELVSARQYILFSRIVGLVNLRVYPIQLPAFRQVAEKWQMPFNCVLSDGGTVEQVSSVLRTVKRNWLHVSSAPNNQILDIRLLSNKHLLAYVKEVADALPNSDSIKTAALREIKPGLRATRAAVQCPTFNHNLTLPNETGLRALRFSPSTISSLNPASYPRYVDAILRTAKVLSAERQRLLRCVNPGVFLATAVVLAAESVVWQMFRGTSASSAARGSRRSSSEAESILRKVARQEKYILEVLDSENEKRPDLVELLTAQKEREMRAFTAALCVLGGPTMTPVIRLEPRINQIRSSLIDLQSCARGNSPHRDFKLNKLSRRIRRELRAKVDPRIMAHLEKLGGGIEGITLVSDIPLEWLPVANQPLSLRHDVSRIPATPGNVLMMQCIRQHRLDIGRSAFGEILVVRSFKDGDRLRSVLEKTLNDPAWKPAVGHKFRFVDVQNHEEFIAAVEGFKGAMMVFDGHGTRDPDSAVGSLVVGGRPLDVWSMRNQIAMPPIVLLSACDTLPLDGSHGSSAVGILMLGAVTVLATVAPIDGLKAAVLLTRLAYRLEMFLPIALGQSPRGVCWRSFVSGMLRMSYATDVLYALRFQHRLLNENDVKTIGSRINLEINTGVAGWHANLVKYVCDAARAEPARVLSAIGTVSELTDSMKYVQIGRPELIYVVDETSSEVISRHAELLGSTLEFRPFG